LYWNLNFPEDDCFTANRVGTLVQKINVQNYVCTLTCIITY